MIKYIVFIVLILSTSIGFCKEDNRRGVFIKFLSSSPEVKIKTSELKIIGEILEKKISANFDVKEFYIMSKKDIETLLPKGKSLEDCKDKCDVEIGRLIQADIMISSRLSRGFGKYFIHVNVIDTETSEILNKTSFSEVDLKLLLSRIERFNFKSMLLNRNSKRNGFLTIATRPPSEIFVNEESIGITPIVEYEMEEGNHIIEMITLKGNFKYAQKINIVADQINVQKFQLKEEVKDTESRTRSITARELLSNLVLKKSKTNNTLPEVLSREQILKTIRKNLRRIRKCKSLDPSRSGKVIIRFVVQSTGQVLSASVTTASFEGTKVGRCLNSQAERFRFPRFRKSFVRFKFPFIL